MLDKRDGGWKSRKFWHSMITSGLILAAGLFCAMYPAMVPLFPELAMALLGVYSIFAGANVANSWTIARNSKVVEPDPKLPPKEQSPGD